MLTFLLSGSSCITQKLYMATSLSYFILNSKVRCMRWVQVRYGHNTIQYYCRAYTMKWVCSSVSSMFHLFTRLLQELGGWVSCICEMNVILLEIFLFRFRAAYKLWLASYSPKHTLLSFSDTPFCVYYKYNSKTTVCLQLCYELNNSFTIKDALFHVTSGKVVATCKLQPHTNIAVLLFVCSQDWQQNSGHIRL